MRLEGGGGAGGGGRASGEALQLDRAPLCDLAALQVTLTLQAVPRPFRAFGTTSNAADSTHAELVSLQMLRTRQLGASTCKNCKHICKYMPKHMPEGFNEYKQ